jgi:hypothetical protein
LSLNYGVDGDPVTGPVQPGQAVDFRLDVAQTGPWTVTAARLDAMVSAPVGQVTVQTTHGSCVFANGRLECGLGYLVPNTMATVWLRGQLQAEGVAALAAETSCFEGDFASTNDQVAVAFPVVAEASRTLRISRSADSPEVVLAWPATTTPWQLESTTNLLGAGAWTPVSQTPEVVGGYNVIVLVPQGRQQFYRLRWP